MHYVDALALWLVWWCAAAALSAGHEVRDWRALLLSLGLIVVSVSSFIGAIAVVMRPGILPIWTRWFVYGTAIVAAWLYDHRFGIVRHALLFAAGARALWATIRGLPERLRTLRTEVRSRRS